MLQHKVPWIVAAFFLGLCALGLHPAARVTADESDDIEWSDSGSGSGEEYGSSERCRKFCTFCKGCHNTAIPGGGAIPICWNGVNDSKCVSYEDGGACLDAIVKRSMTGTEWSDPGCTGFTIQSWLGGCTGPYCSTAAVTCPQGVACGATARGGASGGCQN